MKLAETELQHHLKCVMDLNKKLSEIQKRAMVNKVVSLVLMIQTSKITKLYGELSEKEKRHIQNKLANIFCAERNEWSWKSSGSSDPEHLCKELSALWQDVADEWNLVAELDEKVKHEVECKSSPNKITENVENKLEYCSTLTHGLANLHGLAVVDFEFDCNLGTFNFELIWLFLRIFGAMHALLNAETDIRRILHHTKERLDQLKRAHSNKAKGMG